MRYVYIITADSISDELEALHRFATTDMKKANEMLIKGRNQLPQFRWTWESIPLDCVWFETAKIDFMFSQLPD
jgi:hypothetical protein